MNPSLKKIVFYIVIAGGDKTDHLFLRRAVNKLVPQAIVESLYEGRETLSFIKNGSTVPHLIFLDRNMISVDGGEMISVIRNTESFKNVPLIVLTDNKDQFSRKDLVDLGVNEFYSKPYHVKALDHIVNEVREKWFTAIVNKKNIS